MSSYQNGPAQVLNGAKATIYGVDFDSSVAVTSQLVLDFGAELLHDRFDSFPAAVIPIPQPNGGNVSVPGSAKGNRLPFAADGTFNGTVTYTVPLSSGKLVFSGSVLHSTGYYPVSDNVYRQPAFNTINTSLTWTSTNDRYNVQLWAKNLANEAVITQLATTTATTFGSYAPPRTFGVRVGAKF